MTWPVLRDVSRETNERLFAYADLLIKWNPKINLVSRASLDDLWARHILDSLQIFRIAPHPVGHWVDLGSGGGFPGVVVAILGTEIGSPCRVTLVESDQRKCAFLRTALRETGTTGAVISERIENIPPLEADVLSARALANLELLMAHAERHLAPDGTAIFPKGASWEKELESTRRAWLFNHDVTESETEPGSAILSFTGVARV